MLWIVFVLVGFYDEVVVDDLGWDDDEVGFEFGVVGVGFVVVELVDVGVVVECECGEKKILN